MIRAAALLAWLVLAASFCAVAAAQSVFPDDFERVASFHADIAIAPDGALTVSETIVLVAAGDEVRRGFVRSFPTEYRDGWGFVWTVGFEVLSVTRDGAPEPYAIEDIENGVDIRIGSADVLLDHGPHTYVLTYRTDRQIGFYDGHDEIYWNVTGNDWQFVIEQASATVRLPPGAAATKLTVFTGAYGAAGTDAVIAETAPGVVEAHTTALLGVREGVTVAAAFPKGFVTPPAWWRTGLHLLADNPGVPAALLGFGALLFHVRRVRRRDGPDPRPGIVVPLFDPPDGLSPADARYLDRFAFDDEGFAATVLNLAALGFVTVEAKGGEDGDPAYTIARRGEADDSALPAPERAACRILFGKGRKKFAFKSANGETTRAAYAAVESVLTARHHPKHVGDRADPSLGCLGIVVLAGLAILILTSGWTSWLVAGALFAGMMVYGFSLLFSLGRRATPAGQALRDQVEGLRMYLGAAEEERWNTLHPPELTPDRFERLFPYALALGVDQAWSERFARHLALAGMDSAAATPSYVHATGFAPSSAVSFASGFAHAVAPPAPAVTAGSRPGSGSAFSSGSSGSSGSTGGGFSGGGGGGGGGRGW